MITEIRNKITAVGETVTSNFYYQNAPKDQAYPYCVYAFFGNEIRSDDTQSEFEDIYFQVSSYQRTDGLTEALADSIETAFASADMSTTNYRCIGFRKLKRVAFPQMEEVKGKRLITEFYIYYEKI